MSPLMKTIVLGMLLLAGLMMIVSCGSSTQNPNVAFDPDKEAHPAGWLPAGHMNSAKADIATCEECHGADLSGGISKNLLHHLSHGRSRIDPSGRMDSRCNPHPPWAVCSCKRRERLCALQEYILSRPAAAGGRQQRTELREFHRGMSFEHTVTAGLMPGRTDFRIF